MGSTFDLTSSKNIYYLNPLDLLSPSNIPYAKTICVATCPNADTCGINSFPCTNGNAFRWELTLQSMHLRKRVSISRMLIAYPCRCPYYAFAENNLYGKLTGVGNTNVAYYSSLTTMSGVTDPAATALINVSAGREWGVSSVVRSWDEDRVILA